MGRRQELFEYAHKIGVKILTAKESDKSKVGIHLLHPDLDALEDAIQVAERDLFPAIYIHRGNPRGPKFNGKRLKLVNEKSDELDEMRDRELNRSGLKFGV